MYKLVVWYCDGTTKETKFQNPIRAVSVAEDIHQAKIAYALSLFHESRLVGDWMDDAAYLETLRRDLPVAPMFSRE